MFTCYIKHTVVAGRGGVKWDAPETPQSIIDAAKKTPNPLSSIRDKIQNLSIVPSEEKPDAKVTREALRKSLETELLKIESESKKQQEKLNSEAIENKDFIRKFGNRVNLGAVVLFIEKQEGKTINDKIQAAINDAKNLGPDQLNAKYAMKSKLSDGGGLFLSEQNALASMLESMVKSPKLFDDLKIANIPLDRKVDPTKLTDLFADLDDDGVIEAVNGVNDTGIWKKFKGLFVDNDAMQSEYFGEHQAASKMKNEVALKDMLKTINVEQSSGEDLKVFAKRARAALLMSASISGTAELDPKSALARMQKSNEYSKERSKIESQIAEIQKKIEGTNENITPENANKIARSFASVVTSYTASIGIGSANADAIMQQLGQAVVSPKGNVTLIGVDMGIMAKVVNTEKFKASLGAGIGGGFSSDGFFAFAHVDAQGKFTMIDNSTLEDLKKNSGNTTLNLGLHGGLDLQSFRTVPAVSLDILWNDKIDSLDNALLKMNSILDKLTVVGEDGKITLNLSELPKGIDPIFRSQLQSLKYLVENGNKNITPSQQNAHAILMRDRFMQSFKVFLGTQPSFKGLSFAGIKFAVVPGALLAGPVFQDIGVERTAKIVQSDSKKIEAKEQSNVMNEFGLTWDPNTRKLTRIENNATQIVLANGLAWDKEVAQIVFPEGKMPKFSLNNGIENTLGGATEKVLTISSVDMKTPDKPQPIVAEKVKIERTTEALSDKVTTMIQSLPINRLIERPSVKNFMVAMTAGDIEGAILIAKGQTTPRKIPGIIEFKNILDEEKDPQRITAILEEIDEKLVGDKITRGFNAAKGNNKAFSDYKILLRSRGAILRKDLTRENMTLADIASVSYDKKGLRDQELNIIVGTSGIDKTKLAAADTKMLDSLKFKDKLETEGSGYMLMARNRAGKGQQGARKYETGSYIAKEDLNLTPAVNIAAIKKSLGMDLVKIALANLASRSELSKYKDKIQSIDSTKVPLDKDGKATVDLGNKTTLNIDLSNSKVYSALYGDSSMKSSDGSQAVCVNVGLLLEPMVAGSVTVDNNTIQVPEMEMSGDATVMPGTFKQTTASILTVLARPKPPETTKPPAQDPKPPAQDPKPPAQDPKPPAQDPKPPAQDPKPPAQDPKLPAQDPKLPAQDPKLPAQDPKLPAQDPGSKPIIGGGDLVDPATPPDPEVGEQ